MTPEEFKELVKTMRALQIEYFKNHDHQVLSMAKSTERKVDDYLSGKYAKTDNQPKLF